MSIFDDEIEVGGERYPCFRMGVPDGLEDRFAGTAIVDGIPSHIRDEMLRAAQLSDGGHGWRVGEQVTEEEVTPELIVRARALYEKDLNVYKMSFLTFLALGHDGEQTLIGCAGARRMIDPEYESRDWIVLTRLLAVPELRKLGFGKMFTFAFFAASQTMCGPPATGCFLPTDTDATRKLCQRAVKGGALDMVQSGVKRYHVLDSYFDVDVYLAFYPGKREEQDEAAAAAREGLDAGPLDALLDAAEAGWKQGFDAKGGAALGALFREHEDALARLVEERPSMMLYLDYLRAQRAMGCLEPEPS